MKSYIDHCDNIRLRADADHIIRAGIRSVLPGPAVEREIERMISEGAFSGGRIILVAIGKAAWTMTDAAVRALDRIDAGIVITKYGHVQEDIPGVECYEAGHPEPDENGFRASRRAVEMVSRLTENDTVLLLISGGGSALFEIPLIPYDDIRQVTHHLLMSGADITEINTVRKRLSAVKGGKFAEACAPAHVHNIILSDVLGDPVDMIASGPGWPDSTTGEEAISVFERYGITLSDKARDLILETNREHNKLNNVTASIIGNVEQLCAAVIDECEALGYETTLLTDRMTCEASKAGELLGITARAHAGGGKKKAFVCGGETIVHVTGSGLGGRNQETALAAAPLISGLDNVAVFSVGSDGTDGPTDAAGGFVDGSSMDQLRALKLDPLKVLKDNDSYHALEAIGGLIRTGPTGTNVNDVAVALVNTID